MLGSGPIALVTRDVKVAPTTEPLSKVDCSDQVVGYIVAGPSLHSSQYGCEVEGGAAADAL